MIGKRSKVNMVDVIKPPITTMAKVFCVLEPILPLGWIYNQVI